MYALIITIHAVFIGITHLLWYRIFEGIFVLFWIFFLFYFSPLFFLDGPRKNDILSSFSFEGVLSQFSPKNSLLLPITLLYIAIYWFLFSIFGSKETIIFLHTIIIFWIYILFIGYAMGFYWKSDIFFEILRFHTLFNLIGTILFSLYFFFQSIPYEGVHILLWISGLLSATFLLFYTQKENIIFIYSYLLSIFATIFMGSTFFFLEMTPIVSLAVGIITALFIFEYFPKMKIFAIYINSIQYFTLFLLIFSFIPLAFLATKTSTIESISLLGVLILFFLSIHARYTNYIVYLIWLFGIFFVYGLLFSGLLLTSSPWSTFLFVFFLPILLIATTYFWQEKHEYDFLILHYSWITFSLLYSVYLIFFIGWWGELLFMISLCVFGVALLLFLSYFRFRITHTSSLL